MRKGVEQHLQFIRLSRHDLAGLITRMDDASAVVEARPRGQRPYRRVVQRWSYRQHDLACTVEHPAGGVARMLVSSRNLSANGISLLHGGYLYPGSRCRVCLPRFDGELSVLSGQVLNCNCVEGVVHEINMGFARPIDPKMYLQSRRACPIGPVETVDPPVLRGTILLASDSEPDRMLVRHWLEETGVELTTAATAAEALERFDERIYDIVLADLRIAGDCGLELINTIRRRSAQTAIVLFTAETRRDRLEAAFAAGADHLLSKPNDVSELHALLYDIQCGGRASGGGELIYSSLQHEQGMSEIIEHFVEHAHAVADEIALALGERDLERVRRCCLDIKGTAAGAGFLFLSEAANEAIHTIDLAESMDALGNQVRVLCELARRLGRGA